MAGRALAKRPVWIGLSLYGLVVAVFFSAVQNDFLYWYGDDPLYVLENRYVNSGLSLENIGWAFTSTERSNWHPLTWISHMLDVEIYGLKPWGHHLTSIQLHGLNTVLLFVALWRMTGATWRSFAVAALFGIHPLRVESVAWVSERKDVLSCFFWMLTTLLYVLYVEQVKAAGPRRKLFYGLSLCSTALGLMSKGMLVTLPFVLLLLDFWPLRRVTTGTKTLIIEKIPFLLLALATSMLTFQTQKSWGFVATLNAYPFDVRLENAVVSYIRYIGKLFWPVDLCSFYPHPGHWPIGLVWFAGITLILISVAAMLTHRNRPYLGIGWLWYLGTLVPVIGLIQVGGQSIADRYSYIPTVGILLILVWGGYELAQRFRVPSRLLMIGLAAVVLPLIVLSHQHVKRFKDSVTLWSHNVLLTGKYGIAQYALGLAQTQQGNVDEGIRELTEIVERKPDWIEVRGNLAGMLVRKGKLAEARKHCEAALQLNPNYPLAHQNLAMIYRLEGNLEKAITHFVQTIQYDPQNAGAHYFLGLALLEKGLFTDAAEVLSVCVHLNPMDARAHNFYGAALGQIGEAEAGMHHLRLAIRLDPDFAEAHNNLGVALFNLGRNGEAAAHFQEALRSRPGFDQARQNLAAAQQAAAEKSNATD